MKKSIAIIRQSDRRSFELELQIALNDSWVMLGSLQIIEIKHWFIEPTLIYIQMMIKEG